MSAYREAAVAYLRTVIEKTGKDATELAMMVGTAHTTFTRPLNNPDYKYAPKYPKLQRLEELTGVPMPSELVNNKSGRSSAIRTVDYLQVRWVAAAGLWMGQDFAYDRPLGTVPMVEDPAYEGLEQWAERIEGESMNLEYDDGDFVHVVSTIDLRHEPKAGDCVIVVRTDPTGKIERACKMVAMIDGRRVVRGHSANPIWNKPIDVAADPESTVEILGLVVGMYRPRRA